MTYLIHEDMAEDDIGKMVNHKNRDLVDKIYHIAAPNMNRVIPRLFISGDQQRSEELVRRVLAFSKAETKCLLDSVIHDFKHRHRSLESVLIKHFEAVHHNLPTYQLDTLPKEKKLLIGAYFTMEYAFEAAAFLNPSIVLSPNQEGLDEGDAHVIMSFRTVGEGHISSLVFRSGVITKDCHMVLDPVSTYAHTPDVVKNPIYDKKRFTEKLKDISIDNIVTQMIFRDLPDHFNFHQLKESLAKVHETKMFDEGFQNHLFETIRWIARSNYHIEFSKECDLSECVIFPTNENESHGIEDARFVRFIDDDGSSTYYATYTAYNGRNILPQMFKTNDFRSFETSTLNGVHARNKGMALFPRKIDGKYAMISRLDGVQMYIMYSDNLNYWHSAHPFREPLKPWEYVQMGNCGSPIETKDGWLLITHGVGPMRKYCISVELLDLNDPFKVVGRLKDPLLIPDDRERNGYVPNVVYSCGAVAHNGSLVLPYAYSDYGSKCAIIPIEPLIEKMKKDHS